MDFAAIDPTISADDGVDMEIRHPNTGVVLLDKNGDSSVIRVRGPHSKKYKEYLAEHERKRMKGGAVDDEKFTLGFAVVATISWKNISWEGKPLECTAENMRMLYGKRDFIAAQVAEFIKPGNFTTPTSAS